MLPEYFGTLHRRNTFMTTTHTPDSRDSFVNFFAALNRHEDEAWSELTRRYTRRLIGLARKKLDVRLGSKLDPEDVVQSVYRLLHARIGGAGLRAQSWEHLWGMLALLTAMRCKNWFRHYLGTQRRGLETSLPGEEEGGDEAPVPGDYKEPTPEEAAELADELRRLVPRLDPHTARIFWLGMLGFTDAEITRDLGVSEARVRFAREDCTAVLAQTLHRAQTDKVEQGA
jgi:DNA-directed RNA polymerase specialized sigma24 family protein